MTAVRGGEPVEGRQIQIRITFQTLEMRWHLYRRQLDDGLTFNCLQLMWLDAAARFNLKMRRLLSQVNRI